MFYTLFKSEDVPFPAEELVADCVEYDGEALVGLWYLVLDAGAPCLRDLMRLTVDGGKIVRWVSLYYSPEALDEVGAALGTEVRGNGHRYAAPET